MGLNDFLLIFIASAAAVTVGNVLVVAFGISMAYRLLDKTLKDERAKLEKYIVSMDNYSKALDLVKNNNTGADFTIPFKKNPKQDN